MPYTRPPDFLHQQLRNNQRLRDLEISPRTTHVESFILDPISERAFPPAIAVFTESQIFGVALYHTSPGPVTVQFNAGPPGSPTVLHTFTSAAGGTVHNALGDAMSYGPEYELEPGDVFYPEIIAGAGGGITAAFMIG